MKKLLSGMLLIIMLITVCAMPAAAIEADDFESKAVVLVEAKTGKVLYEKNKDEQLSMASITKLMLLLITMEDMAAGKISLEDTVVGSPKAKEAGGSTIFLDVEEKMSVDDILKGICINSANDAAIALAETISGSESDFVVRMNARAAELGLENTHYVNVTGFDADGHYSSAYDIAKLSREILLKHPKILEYSQIREDWLRGKRTQLLNTNKLLSTYQYATGLKTGTETNAKYCLSATASKDGMDLIAVVLGAPTASDRFSEAKELLEYGYDSFEIATPVEQGEYVGDIPVIKGETETAKTVIENQFSLVVPKTYANKVKKEVIMDENVKAPVAAGTRVGTMKLIVAGEETEQIPVVIAEDVQRINFWQALGKMIKSIFSF